MSQDVGSWRDSWILSKLDLFSTLIKLRSTKFAPEELWKQIFENCRIITSGSSNFVTVYWELYDKFSPEQLRHKCRGIIDWLNSELKEVSDNVMMSEGRCATKEAERPVDSSLSSENAVENTASNEDSSDDFAICTFSSPDDYCRMSRVRMSNVFDTMMIFAQSDSLRPFCSDTWSKNLHWAKVVLQIRPNDEQTEKLRIKLSALNSVLAIEKSDNETSDKSESGGDSVPLVEKYRQDDDLYLLQNGLPGYQEAMTRILAKIGGHEWNVKILEVLEQRAGIIDSFDQVKMLVDVLEAASKMIDMRVQTSLYTIFKTAFNQQKFAVKKQIMNYYYQKYQLWNSSECDSQYGTELNSIINSLSESWAKGTFRQMAVRLSWHFMLSSKTCWWRLLNAIMAMPKLTHALVEIIKCLPVVSSLKIPDTDERLIFAGLKRLLEHNSLKNEDNESAWCNLCVALCNGHPKKPVYEPAFLINDFLLPLLPTYPWILLPCFFKLITDKTAIIHFRQPLPPPPKKVAVEETTVDDEHQVDATSTERSVVAEVIAQDDTKLQETSESRENEDHRPVEKPILVENSVQSSSNVPKSVGNLADRSPAIDPTMHDASEEVAPDDETVMSCSTNECTSEKEPAKVEIVNPLTFFGAFFAVYVRATKEGHADTSQNLKVRCLCSKLLYALTEYWNAVAVAENRPFLIKRTDIDAFQSEYSGLPWTKRLFLHSLLQKFRDEDDLDVKKPTLIDVPRCLFDKFNLPSTLYSGEECCETDGGQVTFDAMNKMHAATCALSSLIECSLISPQLSKKLLRDSPDFGYFTALAPDAFRKYLVEATLNQLRDKGSEDFRKGVQCLRDVYDRMEEEHNRATKKNDDSTLLCRDFDSYKKGMKYAAPLIICCDAAVLLIKQARADADKLTLKLWLTSLGTLINESCSRLAADTHGVVADLANQSDASTSRDPLACLTAMRQLWSNVVELFAVYSSSLNAASSQAVDQSPKVAAVKQASDMSRRFEFLLVSLFDNFRRANLRFDRSLLLNTSAYLSKPILDAFERKLHDVQNEEDDQQELEA